MPVFRERGVMRNLLIETQSREPAPCQMHAQLLHQLAFTGDAIQIANQQDAQQKFGINGRTAGIAVTDRKSTRLNSSHLGISYAVFCLKKKIQTLSYCISCLYTLVLERQPVLRQER